MIRASHWQMYWALCFGDVGEMTLKEWQKRRWS